MLINVERRRKQGPMGYYAHLGTIVTSAYCEVQNLYQYVSPELWVFKLNKFDCPSVFSNVH